ncbi:MAG: hypothetical protein F4Z72_05665 [Gemmatimonadales bacterium]|nr:hypothetical protein [Candidatus Palauibacter irciniicola]MYC17057.1 hypothetical protein [Gemmatimonadales bacterium]
MTEPAVTLTDYGLTLLCAVLVWLARSRVRADLRPWAMGLFAGSGAAALFAGTVHGFFGDAATFGYRVLWPATILTVGATGLAAWGLGARVGGQSTGTRWITRLAALAYVAYVAVVLAGWQAFAVAVAFYLPAVIYLTVRFALAYRRRPTASRRWALIGFGLTFAAAAIQQLQIPIHPVWFDHNALYHVVQAAAFVLLYQGVSGEE